jgi:hypothetical protein
MNFGNYDKIFKDAMNLFNTFGVFTNPKPNPSNSPSPPPYPDYYNQGIRPPLPIGNSPNLKKREFKSVNQYYLERIKNFLSKEI